MTDELREQVAQLIHDTGLVRSYNWEDVKIDSARLREWLQLADRIIALVQAQQQEGVLWEYEVHQGEHERAAIVVHYMFGDAPLEAWSDWFHQPVTVTVRAKS